MKMKWNEITMATAEKMIVRLSVHDWFRIQSAIRVFWLGGGDGNDDGGSE